MPLGKQRDKVVYGLAKARGSMHRYTRWRWAAAIAFTLAIATLPAFDILRFDFWSGRHAYLGRELGLVEVAKRFAFPFLAINVLIIVLSRFLGRYLCGFVCPYGAVARLAEWLKFRAKSARQRIGAAVTLLVVCALLSAITLWFWVDPRVFRDGSLVAISVATAFALAMVVSFFFTARNVGLGFCRKWCPSGVYFALLGHETVNAIEFEHPSSCTECKACDKACPMDLAPRALADTRPTAAGMYGESMTSFALCIRCGDCVAACEATTARNAVPTPLRMGFLSKQPSADALESADRNPC